MPMDYEDSEDSFSAMAKRKMMSMMKSKKAQEEESTDNDEFDADSDGYDYSRAKKAGMKGDGTGENEGHWGSVAPATDEEKKKFGLPDDAYIILKGKNHPTWDKAVAAEKERGAQIVKVGDRYFSVKFSDED